MQPRAPDTSPTAIIPATVQERLLEALEQANVDVLVAHTYGAIRHLTGGWYSYNYADFPAGADHQHLPWLILDRRHPSDLVYLCSDLERGEARLARHPIAEISRSGAGFTKVGAPAVVARVLRERNLNRSRIGLELPFLPTPMLASLRDELPHAEVVDVHPVLLYVRAVKTDVEIALLAAAAGVLEEVLKEVFAAATEGMIDSALEVAALTAIGARGGVPTQRFILPGIGPKRIRHGAGNPVSQVLRDRDVLLADLGAKVGGMHGDLVRMGSLGEPTFPVHEAVSLGAASNSEFAAWLRPGMIQRDAFNEAQRIAARHADAVAPWGQPTALHHGLGWSLYEPPFDLSWHGGKESDYGPVDPYGVLEEGMVFSLETAVFSVDGTEIYANIEDPYVLRSSGCKRLNTLPPDVIACGAGSEG